MTVRGMLHPVVVSNLQRMENNYGSIAATASDGMRLHLHVFGVLEPGGKTPPASRLYLDTASGHFALLKSGSSEITLPEHLNVGSANPNVMAALHPDEAIHFTATVTFDHQPLSQFSGHEARLWMAALDRRISHRIGFVLDMLAPDTRTLLISVPPRGEFDVTTNGQKRELVLNQGDTPYLYEVHPRDYAADAQFASTIPLVDIAMRFPITFNTWHGR